MNKNTLLIIILVLLIVYFCFKQLCSREGFESVIPLNLYQTWHSKKLDEKMQECVDKLKYSNPEFNHYLYDENDCEKFIEDNFNKDVLIAYRKLIPSAFKADLWRYCILYINGGIYIDIKYYTVNGFKLIELTDKEYFVKDIEPNGSGVYNAFIICKPGNKKLLNAINNIVKNTNNNFYGNSAFEPTGPLLLKQEFRKDEIENMRLSIGENECPTKTCINLDGRPILAIYKEYYSSRMEKNINYHEAWKNRNIYTNKNL
jgi:mannosyltransferase OCH1-like enzyme